MTAPDSNKDGCEARIRAAWNGDCVLPTKCPDMTACAEVCLQEAVALIYPNSDGVDGQVEQSQTFTPDLIIGGLS